MKISNQKNIETLGIFLACMLVLDVALIGLRWLIFRQPDWFILTLLALLIILLIKLSNLRYTEFENSGFVISIKKKYLLHSKSFVIPLLEFPTEFLKESGLKSQVVYININSDNPNKNKIHVFKINLAGFTKEQRSKIIYMLRVK